MGRPIEAHGGQAGALLIDNAYRSGDARQFLRELMHNGIEAEATKIQFGIHWTGVNRGDGDWGELPEGKRLHRHRYRLVYYDNGCGMGAAMADYMSGLLAIDSKDQTLGSVHGNFGQGVRVSLLPWNRAGVIVASWSEDVPDGQLMWMHYNPGKDQYEALTLEWEEPDGTARVDEVAPADLFREFIDDRPEWLGLQADGSVGTGTMFLLLGNTGQEHTFLGPEGNWNNYTGLVALAQRYWEHPPELEVRYENPGEAAPDNWASRSRDRKGRTTLDGSPPSESRRAYNMVVHPQRAAVAQPFDQSAITLPDGGLMHVFLSRKAPANFTGNFTSQQPSISVRYRDELYHRRAKPADYRRFAVSYPSVYQRLWIVIEPRMLGVDYDGDGELTDPWGGVYPTSSRTSLQYLPPLKANGTRPPGRDLPWSAWEELFIREMPAFVEAALTEAMSGSNDDVDPDVVAQIAAPFVDRWSTRWAADPNGTVVGLDDDRGNVERSLARMGDGEDRPGTAPMRRRREGRADSDGDRMGSLSKIHTRLPNCRLDVEPFVPYRDDRPRPGAMWTPGRDGGTVFIDPEHPVLEEVFRHWRAQFTQHDQRNVEQAVKTVYEAAMTCRVAQILRYGELEKMTEHELTETLLSSSALTAALFGLASEDAVIKQRTSGFRKVRSA